MKLKTSWYVLRAMFDRPGYKWLVIKTWLIVLILFLWLPRINLLAYIFTQAPLSIGGKLGFVWDDFTRLLSSLTNPIILSMVTFSILTALSITLLIFLIRTSKRLHTDYRTNKKAQVGVATAAIGSHILSCGGTLLLAPIFPALSGSSSILGGTGATVNLWLGTSANLAGILLVLIAINRTSKDMVRMLAAMPWQYPYGVLN